MVCVAYLERGCISRQTVDGEQAARELDTGAEQDEEGGAHVCFLLRGL